MKDFVDASAFNTEQGNRARKLFAAVVLAALDDAIADDRKYGNGPEQIARWARSRAMTLKSITSQLSVIRKYVMRVSKQLKIYFRN